MVVGAGLHARAAHLLWGWPLMSWSAGTGLSGLLTFPFAVAASMLRIGHVSIIISFGVASVQYRFTDQSPNLWLRLASFVWTAAYLYYYGHLVPLPSGESYQAAPLSLNN